MANSTEVRRARIERACAALVWTLTCAAIDSASVRAAFEHRELGLALFAQSVSLWGAFALLALVPAVFCEGLLQRVGWWPRRELFGAAQASTGWKRALLVGFWMLLPVLAHERLDRYTGIGQTVDALRSPWPWLEIAGATLGLAAIALVLARIARGFPLAVTALAVSLGAVGLGAWSSAPEQRAASRGALPQDAARPNVLLLVLDTLRADHLESYGYARNTAPCLSELARESLLFEQVHSVSRFTFSSHLSLLTGQYPSQHGARLLDMRFRPERGESIAELLRRAGYRTGAFVGTNVLNGQTGIARGFEVYRDQVDPPVCDTRAWALVHDLQAVAAKLLPFANANGLPHWFQDFQRPADPVLAEAAEWIAADDARPWFAFVNLYDVHWPYLPSDEARAQWVAPYDGPLDGYLFRSDDYPPGYTPNARDNQHLAQLYDAELFDLDAKVGAFLDGLQLERGGTVVLLTSDHGEAFGEGGLYEHDDILEPQLRVPLIVRLPQGEPTGRRIAGPASGIDVAPTLLRLAGLEPLESMQGLDLVRASAEAHLPARDVLVEDRDHVDPADQRLAFYRAQWKLARRGSANLTREQLFDLSADPVGLRDLSAQQEVQRTQLAAALDALRALWGGEVELVEGEGRGTVQGLDALGYTGE